MKHKTVEQVLYEHCKQPGARVTDAERNFIADVRHYAKLGVDYGWMQQMIEIEWNAVSGGMAWGPAYYEKLTQKLEMELKNAKRS